MKNRRRETVNSEKLLLCEMEYNDDPFQHSDSGLRPRFSHVPKLSTFGPQDPFWHVNNHDTDLPSNSHLQGIKAIPDGD